jgi:DnaJ-domain-containing protein 1
LFQVLPIQVVGPQVIIRAYYLDRENLEQIDEADVAAMLSGFDAELRNREHRAWAMAELGLTEPFDEASARREYRRLAMRHHPDRGGDAERLKTINEALKTLLPEDGNKA